MSKGIRMTRINQDTGHRRYRRILRIVINTAPAPVAVAEEEEVLVTRLNEEE